jgi:heme/copper-type cytochrome/quinol oxidase subunit 2
MMTSWRSVSRPAVGAALLLLGLSAADPAAACTVCYGAADNSSPLIDGARLGIFLLLGVTGVVLGAFARFFFYLRTRARQAENEQITSEWAQLQRSSST